MHDPSPPNQRKKDALYLSMLKVWRGGSHLRGAVPGMPRNRKGMAPSLLERILAYVGKETIVKRFGEWLRKRRKTSPVSYYRDLRKGIHFSLPYHWERGTCGPTRKTLDAFCSLVADYLEVSPEEIYLRAGRMPSWWLEELNRNDHPLDMSLQLALLSTRYLPPEDRRLAMHFLHREIKELKKARRSTDKVVKLRG